MKREKEASFFKEMEQSIRPYKKRYMLSVILSAISVLCELLSYAFIGILAGYIFKDFHGADTVYVLGLAVICKISGVLFSNLSTLISHKAAYLTLKNLRKAICDKFIRLPMGYFDVNSSGTLKTLLVDRVEDIEKTLAHLLPEMTANLLIPCAMILWMLVINWQLTGVILIWIVLGLSIGMLKMIAIIFAVNAMFHHFLIMSYIYKVIVLGIICIAGVFGLGYFTQLGSIRVGFEMAKDKRLHLGSLFKRLYLGFFGEKSLGNINSTLTTSISNVEQVAPVILIHVIGGILSAVSIVLGFVYYEWRVSVVILVGVLSYLFVVHHQMKVSRREAPKRQLAQMKLTESAIEYIQGISVMKAFGTADKDERVKRDIDGSCMNNINLSEKSIPSGICAGLTIQLSEILILLFAFILWNSGEISPQKAINLLIMSFVIFQSVNQAGSILSMIGILDSSLEDVAGIEAAQEIKVLAPVQNIESTEIEFKNVSFSYGKGDILKGISTRIKANSLTAIVGPSGSGKTTFCKLIPRFYDVCEGEILIGGANVTNITTEELMKKISIVFQNVYLFEDTILNNIRLSKPNASDEEVISAAKKASCHDFISQLTKGYETKVGEAGNTLSGGEKQRLAIARAILKDAPIVILDEFTSALDVENEHHILKAIHHLVEDKTVIMIAHRLETIRKADHIIVLDKGKIAQEGTHEELMGQDGIYQSFITIREQANTWKFK